LYKKYFDFDFDFIKKYLNNFFNFKDRNIDRVLLFIMAELQDLAQKVMELFDHKQPIIKHFSRHHL